MLVIRLMKAVLFSVFSHFRMFSFIYFIFLECFHLIWHSLWKVFICTLFRFFFQMTLIIICETCFIIYYLFILLTKCIIYFRHRGLWVISVRHLLIILLCHWLSNEISANSNTDHVHKKYSLSYVNYWSFCHLNIWSLWLCLQNVGLMNSYLLGGNLGFF